jgi:hypothetical protein
MRINPEHVAETLRASPVFKGKRHIRAVSRTLSGFARDQGIVNGDDAAAIPDGDGYLLLAADGITTGLIQDNPYLAGRCAVLANVNDIYAMGGRPIAMVDVLGAIDDQGAMEICRGMRDNAARFKVPIVGGHILRTRFEPCLALAILGRARRLITSFDAAPGDALVLVTKPRGQWLGQYGFFNCTPDAEDATLVSNLELLPLAAEAGLVRAGKDVSMAGIAGTTLMLAESSKTGAVLDLDTIRPPEGVDLAPWLLAFFSYGFVLAVDPVKTVPLCAHFRQAGLSALTIGEMHPGSSVVLRASGRQAELWNHRDNPFTGFAKP